MKVEPPADAKCRDKFLVQSVAVTADKEFTNIAAIVRPFFRAVYKLANGRSGNMSMRQNGHLYKRKRSESYTSPQKEQQQLHHCETAQTAPYTPPPELVCE
jgi:hypothetical protein